VPIQLQKIANQDDGGNIELALKLSTPDRQIESLMPQCKPTWKPGRSMGNRLENALGTYLSNRYAAFAPRLEE
jgi:hypothetical protein